MSEFWNGLSVSLLGSASLIGVHLGQALLAAGVKRLVMADDLSVGRYAHIRPLVAQGAKFHEVDLRDYDSAYDAVAGSDVVFNLAAQHGGRGFVGTHKVELYDNFALSATIFRACADAGVKKVVWSSSACAYPIHVQQNPNEPLKLTEDLIDYTNIKQADGAYGVEKLVSEQMLDAYIEAGAFEGCSTRSFTVYGPLIRESHAIGALIAKTMIKQQPYEIWGDGTAIRNWTYVKDNVAGAMLAAEHLKRGAINIGIEERLTPNIAAEIIWDYMGWQPSEVKYLLDKPVGPLNRVADATKLKELGWRPKYSFRDGIEATVDWYLNTHKVEDVREKLEKQLMAK